MWNVLFDEQEQLGIVDWEAGQEEGFPLVDFCYAFTDAVAATRGYRDRLAAFKASFTPDGVYAGLAGRLLKRLTDTLQIPPKLADLCFHACWLHHAANEHLSTGCSDPKPFLGIVQYLALHGSPITGTMR
jgi:hypothetical protein